MRESAAVWRRLMTRTKFIGVTGGFGKTMAVECLATILARHAGVQVVADTAGNPGRVVQAILDTRWRHRYLVAEAGSRRPGTMAGLGSLLQPDIAVVLGMNRARRGAFSTAEDLAVEYWQLATHVRPGGTLVLNGDDVRVMTMADRRRHTVITFGETEGCDFRVSQGFSRWPRRLCFLIEHRGRGVWVNTQLVGTHWVPAAAGAVATAVTCGMSLEEAAQVLETVEPAPGRMEPVTLLNGAVVLRDGHSGSRETYEAALAVLDNARVLRRVVVAAGLEDSGTGQEARAKYLGRRIARSSDLAIFVGAYSQLAVEAAIEGGISAQRARGFEFPELAAEYLKQEVRAGDLVLLKGSASAQLWPMCFAQVGVSGAKLQPDTIEYDASTPSKPKLRSKSLRAKLARSGVSAAPGQA